jgi:high-affinity nickel-transport protein
MTIAPKLGLALISAAVLGFRHGFDYDHIAAISDITSVESDRGPTMRLGLLYALGHAATVAVLGSAVVFLPFSLPSSVDNWAERAVGLTLVVLGIYVLGSLFRGDVASVPKSRITVVIRAFQRITWWLKNLIGSSANEKPKQFSWDYNNQSVFVIGAIHGLGAETPSQLLVFLLAADLGGPARGFLGLTMFLTGLLATNTLMTGAAVGIFGLSAVHPKVMRAVTACTAIYSLAVGFVFLLGMLILPAAHR